MAHVSRTATVYSLNRRGLHCQEIEIEIDVSNGLPQFIIVGLPDAAVSEARDRVRSAIKNSGFRFPDTRVTVNLAPAHVRKVGSHFDLAIALGILAASGQAPLLDGFALGELALDGRIRGVRGALSFMQARGTKHMVLPTENEKEVSSGMTTANTKVLTVDSLRQVVDWLEGKEIQQQRSSGIRAKAAVADNASENDHKDQERNQDRNQNQNHGDFADIIGQGLAKRAAEIAAAGHHNILLAGPPGVGKSMIAGALPSILPTMTDDERLETAAIYSVVGEDGMQQVLQGQRPFRAPHHSASAAAIVGGGVHLHPGEISLAHNGVLLLDEMPEFRRDVLEALRQPLESNTISISRAHGMVHYPANIMLVGTQNPCPCGYGGDWNGGQRKLKMQKNCICTKHQIERYRKKLSGPLLDRIDLQVQVTAIPANELTRSSSETAESSAVVRTRVTSARTLQMKRQGKPNASLTSTELKAWNLHKNTQHLLERAVNHHQLSARSVFKTIKVARTIADLDQSELIKSTHIAEALSYTAG